VLPTDYANRKRIGCAWKLPSSAEEAWRDSPRAGAPGAQRKRDSAQPQEMVLVKMK
jgi:hypothetical protein